MMAIKFNRDLPEICHAYNHNAVSFYSDKGMPTYCELAVKDHNDSDAPSHSVTITPNDQGAFHFNFKDIIKRLINNDKFEDKYSPEALHNSHACDTSLWKQVSVVYLVVVNAFVLEDTSRVYFFLKAADRRQEVSKGLTMLKSPQAEHLLMPIKSIQDDTFHYHSMDYFEGYPGEIPLLVSGDTPYTSDQFDSGTRKVAFYNSSSGAEYERDLNNGVVRLLLYMEDGAHKTLGSGDDVLGHLQFRPGENKLEIGGGVHHLSVYVKKPTRCNGAYLKWFNHSGSWSYHLFEHYQDKRKLKSIGRFIDDTGGIADMETQVEMGISSQDTMTLFTGPLEEYQKRLVDTLFESPKVYLYLRGPNEYDMTDPNQWMACYVGNKSVALIGSKDNKYNVKLELIKPKNQTLQL